MEKLYKEFAIEFTDVLCRSKDVTPGMIQELVVDMLGAEQSTLPEYPHTELRTFVLKCLDQHLPINWLTGQTMLKIHKTANTLRKYENDLVKQDEETEEPDVSPPESTDVPQLELQVTQNFDVGNIPVAVGSDINFTKKSLESIVTIVMQKALIETGIDPRATNNLGATIGIDPTENEYEIKVMVTIYQRGTEATESEEEKEEHDEKSEVHQNILATSTHILSMRNKRR